MLRARELAKHAQAIATRCKCAVIPRAVTNPTLVHHGLSPASRWHLVTHDVAPRAVADLYVDSRAHAHRVARLLAAMLGKSLELLDNAHTPAALKAHRRSLAGNPSRSKRARAARAAHRRGISGLNRKTRRASLKAIRRAPFPGNAAQTLHYLEASRRRDRARRARPTGEFRRTIARLLREKLAPNPKGREFARLEAAHMKTVREYAAATTPKRRALLRARLTRFADMIRKRYRSALVPKANPKGRKPGSAAAMLARLNRNVDAYARGRITWSEFDARQRRTWDAIRKAGPAVERAVLAALRRALPNPAPGQGAAYRAGWRRAWAACFNMGDVRRGASHAPSLNPKLIGKEHPVDYLMRLAQAAWDRGDKVQAKKYHAQAWEYADTHKNARRKRAPRATRRRTAARRKSASGARSRKNIRSVRTLSPLAQRLTAKKVPSARLIAARARVLTEAWLRGATQGGHTPSKADIAAVHRASLSRARHEATGNPKRRPLKANPKRPIAALERAKKTFHKWQDRGPIAVRTRTVKAPKALRGAAAELGKLVAVTYRSDKFTGREQDYEHDFKRPLPSLVTDSDGRSLHVVGGGYSITPDGIRN